MTDRPLSAPLYNAGNRCDILHLFPVGIQGFSEHTINDVLVTPVTTKLQQRQFLDLPAILYRDCQCWVPRLRASESELARFRPHPFYNDAECVALLASRAGSPCGRIVAVQNRAHDRRYPNESLGFLGFFESTDDVDVATALFDAAADWLRQRGVAEMRGPVSPSMNYEAGLLIDGFDRRPSFMMPYNAEYYRALWENYGFAKVQDLFALSGYREMRASLDEKIDRIADAARERFDVKFRQLDKSNFRRDVETFLSLYNVASRNTWGFVPLSPDEIRQLSGELRYLIIPELTLMALVEGKVVGAVFGILDYNPIIKRIGGRLFPFGFLRILYGKKRLKRTRVMSINVLPEFQLWGLGAVLLKQLCEQGMAWGLEEVEFSYILESNLLARRPLMNRGAICEKTYRVYQKGV